MMRKRKMPGAAIGTILCLGLLLNPFAEQNRVYGADAPVAINETNFPDENFREYVKDNFDRNDDDELSVSEMESVIYISVSNQGITDLTGVGYFNNLQTLACNDNQLSSLDMSQNTSLTQLTCTGNQLSSLDVSRNVSLESLDCYDNQLSSLDVSRSTSLMRLVCYGNRLSNLDVSYNVDLNTLVCHENQLSSLDVSHNVNLETLWCNGNQLSNLDVSQNASLTNLNYTDNQISVPIYQTDSEYYIDLSALQLDVSRVSEPSTGTYDSGTGHITWQSLAEIGNNLTYQYAVGFEDRKMNVKVNISGDPIKVGLPEETTSATENLPSTEETTTGQDTTQNTEVTATGQEITQNTEATTGQDVPQNTEAAKASQDTPKTGDAMLPVWIGILGIFSVGSWFLTRKKKA